MGFEERAGKYKKVLYFVNVFTFLFGTVSIGLSAWALNSEEQETDTLPDWALKSILGFGVVVVVISLIGIRGAYVAVDKIANREVNWWLIIYFVILLISLALQVAIAGVLLVLAGVVEDAEDGKVSSEVDDLEQDFRDWINENPDKWIDVQNYFDCCGYNSTCDTTATGSDCNTTVCEDTVAPTCRGKLLSELKEKAVVIASISIVFALFELFAFVSAYCLICCIKPDMD